MDQLPDVILLEIFGNLLYVDLCKCAQVCRRWYALAQSARFKKKIIITRPLKPMQFALLVQYHFDEQLEEFKYWNTSYVHTSTATRQGFYDLRTKCPHLKKLVLSSCSLDYVSLKDFPASLKYLSFRKSIMNSVEIFGGRPHISVPHLTCLDVSCVVTFVPRTDLRMFTKLKSLRCLFMEFAFFIDDSGIQAIIDILGQLEVLDVEGTQISNEGVQTILTHGSHLKELYIGHIYIDDGAFQEDHFDRLKKLRTLCVCNTKITSSTTKKFADCGIKFETRLALSTLESISEEEIVASNYGCNHYLQHVCCS